MNQSSSVPQANGGVAPVPRHLHTSAAILHSGLDCTIRCGTKALPRHRGEQKMGHQHKDHQKFSACAILNRRVVRLRFQKARNRNPPGVVHAGFGGWATTRCRSPSTGMAAARAQALDQIEALGLSSSMTTPSIRHCKKLMGLGLPNQRPTLYRPPRAVEWPARMQTRWAALLGVRLFLQCQASRCACIS